MKAIYKITNKINGKIYIGQSIDPYKRFISHISRAKSGSNMKIHIDMREYGSENFDLEILEWTDNPDDKEIYYISLYNSLFPNGYNELIGGVKNLPHKFGEEHHNSKIDKYAVDHIKDLLRNSDYSQIEIANHIIPPISQSVITDINTGAIHNDPNEHYPIRTQTPYHLSLKDVDDIKWLLINSSASVYEISEYYNVSASTIKHINSGRNYHDNTLNYPLKVRSYNHRDSQPVETILAKRSTFTIDT